MLNFSFSTVFMTILVSNSIIIILYLIFHNEKILIGIGYPLIGFFLIIVILRLIFPFEITQISHNIYFAKPFSILIANLRKPRYFNQQVSIWNIFELIWILGVIIKSIQYTKANYSFKQFIDKNGVKPEESSEYLHILEKSLTNLGLKHTIHLRLLPEISVPMVYGLFHSYILIPKSLDLSAKESFYVVRHEISHISHHDLFLKLGMNIICILYWWNPTCILLKKQVETILEMRTDNFLINSSEQKIDYLQCLVRISQYVVINKNNTNTIAFCGKYTSSLIRRFQILTHEDVHTKYKFLKFIMLFFFFSIYIESFFFIFEANYINPEDSKNILIPSSDNSFFINNSDGTYDFYLDDKFIITVDSLERV